MREDLKLKLSQMKKLIEQQRQMQEQIMSINFPEEEEEAKVEESARKRYPSYQVVETVVPEDLPESQTVSLKKPKEARIVEELPNSDYNQINLLPQ